jgi:hypothetical protein
LPGIRKLLDEHDDDSLAALMTNLAGHDMESMLEAFHAVTDDQRICFVVYTIKGFGLPFAGHKDNHAGLMNSDQMAEFKRRNRIVDGAEWDHFAGLDLPPSELQEFLRHVPFAAGTGRPFCCAARAGCRRSCRSRRRRRWRPRRALAASSPISRARAVRSPTASSQPPRMSPSPPTSAAG